MNMIANRAALKTRQDDIRARMRKPPLIVDRSAVDRGIELVRLGQNEIRSAAPTAFGDPSRFGSLVEFALAAVEAERGGYFDPRLKRAANESDPTAGAFLLDTQQAVPLLQKVYGETLVAGLCNRRPTDKWRASVKIPGVDETSRADGSRSGGMLAYWLKESTAAPSVYPRFKNVEFVPNKLVTLAYATNEISNDTELFGSTLEDAAAEEIAFQLDLCAVRGTGVGQPLGVLNSPALITVPKETGQASGTIVRENINKIWKRAPAPSRYRAVWLANEDVDEQLEQLAGNPNTYIPAGVYGNEYPLLKGRPVLTIEQCPALGTPGDLILADLSKYTIIDGGLKPALSLHLSFDNDQVVFRFVLRVDGKPTVTTPITPYNGSSTRSPFVCLGAR